MSALSTTRGRDEHVLYMRQHLGEFGEYLVKVQRRQPSTVARYLDVLDEYASFLGRRNVLRVKQSTIEAFITAGDESASPHRFNNRLAPVRTFYAYLVTHGHVARSPAAAIKRHAIKAKEVWPVSLDEYLTMVEAAEKFSAPETRARDVAIVECLYHLGLRVSELVSLNLGQLDLEAYALRDVRVKGGDRSLKRLNDVVVAALERYLPTRAYLAGEETEAVFVSAMRRRISVRAVQNVVATLALKAGIPHHVTCHLLRHSNASELAVLGVGHKVIQEVLGHKRAATSERYIHVRADATHEALQLLAEATKERREERAETRPEGGQTGSPS